jgi:hypothetical protein
MMKGIMSTSCCYDRGSPGANTTSFFEKKDYCLLSLVERHCTRHRLHDIAACLLERCQVENLNVVYKYDMRETDFCG